MKKLFLLCFIMYICLQSCSDNIAKFSVINNTDKALDSVKISCSGTNYNDKVSVFDLKKDEKTKMFLDLKNISQHDGNYYIEVFFNDYELKRPFGYYSNGIASESEYLIYIENDSIIVKETF